jgi:hypothetical protein
VDVIKEAIQAGKLLPERVGHYRRLLERDPDGTKRTLAKLVALPGLSVEQPANSTRGPIASSAGLPIEAHPLGGYRVVES